MFCISLLSHYQQGEITYTWSKVHIYLIHNREDGYALFFFFLAHNEIYNNQSATQVTWGGMHQCLLEVPFTRGAFQQSWQPNNKSINHILCTSNLVGVTLSLLLGQQKTIWVPSKTRLLSNIITILVESPISNFGFWNVNFYSNNIRLHSNLKIVAPDLQ